MKFETLCVKPFKKKKISFCESELESKIWVNKSERNDMKSERHPVGGSRGLPSQQAFRIL